MVYVSMLASMSEDLRYGYRSWCCSGRDCLLLPHVCVYITERLALFMYMSSVLLQLMMVYWLEFFTSLHLFINRCSCRCWISSDAVYVRKANEHLCRCTCIRPTCRQYVFPQSQYHPHTAINCLFPLASTGLGGWLVCLSVLFLWIGSYSFFLKTKFTNP